MLTNFHCGSHLADDKVVGFHFSVSDIAGSSQTWNPYSLKFRM